MNKEGLRCAAELADARVDVMSTACLVAIMSMGLGYHRQTERELTEVARANQSMAPVMTSAGALVEGLQILGARRISLMAPYMCALTELVVKYIENEGIEVIDAISFEIPDNLEVGRRDPLQLLEDVRRLHTTGADVVVASACVQMPSLPAVQRIEDMLGIRTVSTARGVHDPPHARSPGPRAGRAGCWRLAGRMMRTARSGLPLGPGSASFRLPSLRRSTAPGARCSARAVGEAA